MENGPDQGGDPHSVVSTVPGNSLGGSAFDGIGQNVHLEIAGVSGFNADAGEWINIAQVTIRDANGDITLSDLQASQSDAASGGFGTVYALSDVGQDAEGTIHLNFDSQAIDQSATVVTLSLNEVAGALAVTGGSIETLVLQIDDLSAAEASALTALSVQGITTLVVEGGTSGYTFSIADPLQASLTMLDGATVLSDLNLDATLGGSGAYLLGSGNDTLRLGNGLDSGDNVSGGSGTDTVAALFSVSTIRMPTFTDVEALNAVFSASATFDATHVTGLTTINLGIDLDGNEVASTADADFNNLSSSVSTLNIHASQIDVEMDYASQADATLAINFLKLGGAIQIGDDLGSDIDLIGVKHLSVNNLSNNSVHVQNAIDLHNTTETVKITTTQTDGQLILNDAGLPTFSNAGAVREVVVDAVDGWMNLATFGTFIDDATSLQRHDVSVNNANIGIGFIGTNAAALELEEIIFDMSNSGTLAHSEIVAFENGFGADIALFSVTATSKNYVDFSPFGDVNIFLSGLAANRVEHLVVNANRGGNVELDDQEYSVGLQVYSGSGDIVIRGGDTFNRGFHQSQTADASAHSGDRFYFDSATDDHFFGSTRADTIEFSQGGDDTYMDAAGNDTLTVSNTLNGNATLVDGDVGSDDTYVLNTVVGNTVNMSIGSGDDEINIQGGGIHRIDFEDWVFGTTHIENFGAGTDTLTFGGIGDVTSSFVNARIAAGGSVASLNDNSVYFIEDGDTGVAAQTIADYENLTDVAAFLNAVTSTGGGPGHDNVFVVRNMTTSSAISGDAHDVYIYLYADDGGGNGIQANELTIVATVDTAVLMTSADII